MILNAITFIKHTCHFLEVNFTLFLLLNLLIFLTWAACFFSVSHIVVFVLLGSTDVECFYKIRPIVSRYSILSRIWYSAWMSFNAPAKTSNVWEPFNCLHARAAQRLSKLSGSSQWAVTPMNLRLLVVQQSVVVAMYSTSLIAATTFFFIVLVASAILDRRVGRDMMVALGWRSWIRSLNACRFTTLNGWRPSMTYLITALFMVTCDTCLLDISSLSCLVALPGGVSWSFLFCELLWLW